MRIDLGNSKEVLQDEDTITAELEFSFAQQMGKQVGPLKDKSEHLIETIDSLASMLYLLFDPGTKNNLREGIGHLNNTLREVDQMMANDRSKLNIMLGNLSSITTNLQNNNDQINRILTNIHSISDTLVAVNFNTTIQRADQTLMQMEQVLAKINKGQGTLGQMVNNDTLYQHLDQSARDLDLLLKDLKANPKRYVHFSVFGKKAN